jgi:hypothetical protein
MASNHKTQIIAGKGKQEVFIIREWEGIPERGHVTLDTSIFEELPGNRTKLPIHSVCRTVADRDAMLQSGMETGLNEGYSKLDELLANI